MRYILISFLVLYFSCKQAAKPQLKTYAVVTKGKRLNAIGSGYESYTKVDSIQALTDSAAYFEGVKTYVANLRTSEMLEKSNKIDAQKVEEFQVLDQAGQNVKNTLSEGYVSTMDDFIKSKGNQ